MPEEILLRKTGNIVVLDPSPLRAVGPLRRAFTYQERVFLRGREAATARRSGRSLVQVTDKPCFSFDRNQRMVFPFGFWHRAMMELSRLGYAPILRDESPPPRRKDAYKAYWERLEEHELRPGQREVIEAVSQNLCGRIDTPPGFGKSFLIAVLSRLYPHARIDISVPGISTLEGLYEELVGMLPNVGIIHGGKKMLRARVRAFSANSLGHSDGDADFLFLDECLTGDSLIATPAGPIPIREIRVGTPVFGWDGKRVSVRVVKDRWSNGTRPLLRLRTESGKELKCTSNHPIMTETGWKRAGDLKLGDRIICLASVDAVRSSSSDLQGEATTAVGNTFEATSRSGSRDLSGSGWRFGRMLRRACLSALAGVGSGFVLPGALRLTNSSEVEEAGKHTSTSAGTITSLKTTGSRYYLMSGRPCLGRSLAIRTSATRTKVARRLVSARIMAATRRLGLGTRPGFFDVCRLGSLLSRTRGTAKSGFVRVRSVWNALKRFTSSFIRAVQTRKSLMPGWISWAALGSHGGSAMTGMPTNIVSPCTPRVMTRSRFSALLSGLSGISGWFRCRGEGPWAGLLASAGVADRSSGDMSCSTSQSAWHTSAECLSAICELPHEEVFDLEVEDCHNFFANGLLVHNCHRFASDTWSAYAARYLHARRFGFSATHDKRSDGKDLRVEGLCGPVIYKMSWEQAVTNDLIVPIQVHWRSVVMDTNPCYGYHDTKKMRWGIWRNTYRNQQIAADARLYAPEEQVLITCATLEHAVYLKRHLPEFTLVYASGGMSNKERCAWINQGLITPDEPYMSDGRLEWYRKEFAANKLKKVIATTVWNVGVNFPQLAVLIRADGGRSQIADTQVPGRCSRLGKDYAVLHDYIDSFDNGFEERSRSRAKSYAEHRWPQVATDEEAQILLRRWGIAQELEVT